MDNPGIKTLCAIEITPDMARALVDDQVAIELDGMTAVTLDFDFKYGAGGTSCAVIVATSFDGRQTWRHIARVNFTTANRTAQCNLEGLLSKGITNYQDLAAEGVNDGVLGDCLACYVESVGDYSNTTLAVRASAR